MNRNEYIEWVDDRDCGIISGIFGGISRNLTFFYRNIGTESMNSYKFLQSLEPHIYRKLMAKAKPMGITVQELIRVKLVPEFLFGPVELNPELVRKLLKSGMLKNGSRKVSGNGHLPKSPR